MLCLTAFVCFMWWMTSTDGERLEYNEYYIRTKELPTGLKVDSQVKFIGVPAGSVSAISFVKDSEALIEITMKIRDDLPIKKDSVASIEFQVISGVASINIGRGTRDFEKGERKVIELEDSMLSKLRDNAQNMAEKIGETLQRVDGLLSEQNLKNLEATILNLEKFSTELASEQNAKQIGEILRNINALSAKLSALETREIAANLNTLLKNSDALVRGANGLVSELEKTQSLMRERVASGEFDLRQALSPALLEATNVLSDFQKTLREFRGALYRLEENPYEFFFKEPVNSEAKKGDGR